MEKCAGARISVVRPRASSARAKSCSLPMALSRRRCTVMVLLFHVCLPWSGISVKMCLYEGCTRWASYGSLETRNRTACARHKLMLDVYLIGHLCEFGNGTALACQNRGTYGFLGGPIRCCKTHRKAGMTHLLSRKCGEKGCTKQPVFGAVNTTLPLFCLQHKGKEHVDVVNPRCQLCSRAAVFGDPSAHMTLITGKQRRRGIRSMLLYCRQHRQDGHCNLLSKRCLAEGCPKQPCFGDPITRVPIYCHAHRAQGHEDVKNRRCCHPHGCTRHPAYGDPSIGVAAYCHKHKAPTHVPLINAP